MLLYADEDFPHPAADELRLLGHDEFTAQNDGRQQTPDPFLLAHADALGRVIMPYNRRRYERLHRQGADLSGIVSATKDDDFPALALRIHAAIEGLTPGRWRIRVNRPATP
jgi:hypothetical protein